MKILRTEGWTYLDTEHYFFWQNHDSTSYNSGVNYIYEWITNFNIAIGMGQTDGSSDLYSECVSLQQKFGNLSLLADDYTISSIT